MNDATNVQLIQIESDYSNSFSLGESESAVFVLFISPSQSVTIDLSVSLKGRNANAHIIGIVIPRSACEIHLSTTQLHDAPQAKSICAIRSLLLHDSLVSYTGTIVIKKLAKGSDAYQTHDSMLVSKKAKVQTRPILEILNNAVSCRHGVSIHPITQDVLWYAKSRGLDEKEMKRLYVGGFMNTILEKIPDLPSRDLVYNQVKEILQSL